MKTSSVLILLVPIALQARTITRTAEECDQMAVLSSKTPRLSWAAEHQNQGIFNEETHRTEMTGFRPGRGGRSRRKRRCYSRDSQGGQRQQLHAKQAQITWGIGSPSLIAIGRPWRSRI